MYYPTGLVGDPATRKTCPGAWKTPEEAEEKAAVLRHHLRKHRAQYAGGRQTALTLLSALDAYVGELERQVDSVVVPYGTMKTRRSHLNLCVRPAAEHEPRPQVRDLPGDMARQLVNGIAVFVLQQPEFCTATGLRMRETLAVHTSRIRLDERAIRIDRQLDQSRHWVPGQAPPLIPLKHNRDRTALVWPAFLEVLEELMAWADANTAGWLFAPTRRQKNWVRGRMDQWSRAIELLEDEHHAAVARGVPRPTLPPRWTWAPHYTRHAYGSYSLAPELSGGHGWSVAVVSRSMGHRDEHTTTNIYRHVTD